MIAYPGPPPQPPNAQDRAASTVVPKMHWLGQMTVLDWGAAHRGPSSLSSLASRPPRLLLLIYVFIYCSTSGPRSTTSVAQEVHQLQLAAEDTRTNRPKASGMGWYASYWVLRDGQRSSFRSVPPLDASFAHFPTFCSTHESFSNWSIMELVPDAAPHLVEKYEPLEDVSDTSSVLLLSPSTSEDKASPGLSDDDDDE